MQAMSIKESKASKKAKKKSLLVSRIGALESTDEGSSGSGDDRAGDGGLLAQDAQTTAISFSQANEEARDGNKSADNSNDPNLLVIPVPAPRNNDSTAFEAAYDKKGSMNSASTTKKKLPLLMANVPPALLGTMDDGKKFKLDMSLRPEEVSTSSKMYESVPIEKFGAALLRGMGWKDPSPEGISKAGSDKSGSSRAQGTTILGLGDDTHRERRLGLGATAKPKAKAKRGQVNALPDRTEEMWKKMAEEKVSSQSIARGDLVLIREGELAGRKAIVSETDGVPGLNRIRVTMEANGAVIELNKTHVALISKPSAPAPNKRGRESEEGKTNDGEKKSKHDGQGDGSTYWLVKGIRVRYLSEDNDSHHLKKGYVIDLTKEASVQLDSGATLTGVRQKCLETVLPSTGKLCVVLCGPNRGQKARLLEKDKVKETVRVELSDTSDVIWLPMDAVAAFQ
jgi:hypothetical protein